MTRKRNVLSAMIAIIIFASIALVTFGIANRPIDATGKVITIHEGGSFDMAGGYSLQCFDSNVHVDDIVHVHRDHQWSTCSVEIVQRGST